MTQQSIEIQMLKQQVQLLQQELQQIHQYGNIRTLWNNIFSKLETITFTSQQHLKIYQQLMFRQSVSQDQIKTEYLSQDAASQTENEQIKINVLDIIKSCISSIKIEMKINQDKYFQDNLNQIQLYFENIQNYPKNKLNKYQIIHKFISFNTNNIYQLIQKRKLYHKKSISNLEQEIKDSQINELKKQNQTLKQDIQNLQLIQNQLNTQLEEKEAKLKLLNFMVINQQQQKNEYENIYNNTNFRL